MCLTLGGDNCADSNVGPGFEQLNLPGRSAKADSISHYSRELVVLEAAGEAAVASMFDPFTGVETFPILPLQKRITSQQGKTWHSKDLENL